MYDSFTRVEREPAVFARRILAKREIPHPDLRIFFYGPLNHGNQIIFRDCSALVERGNVNDL